MNHIYADSPDLQLVDDYIRSKDLASGIELIRKMASLEEEVSLKLNRFMTVRRQYALKLDSVERDLASIKAKTPYTDSNWRDSIRNDVQTFCCDLHSNPTHRATVIKWLEDWLEKEDGSKE